MGTMISEPFPVDVRTGSRAMIAVAAVIMAGLTSFFTARRPGFSHIMDRSRFFLLKDLVDIDYP